jgi:hypothetical protein
VPSPRSVRKADRPSPSGIRPSLVLDQEKYLDLLLELRTGARMIAQGLEALSVIGELPV